MKNMIETFMKEEQAIFYSGIVSSVVRLSHELCHGSRLQDYILMKTTRLATASVISSREKYSISICFSDRLSSSSWDLQYI